MTFQNMLHSMLFNLHKLCITMHSCGKIGQLNAMGFHWVDLIFLRLPQLCYEQEFWELLNYSLPSRLVLFWFTWIISSPIRSNVWIMYSTRELPITLGVWTVTAGIFTPSRHIIVTVWSFPIRHSRWSWPTLIHKWWDFSTRMCVSTARWQLR